MVPIRCMTCGKPVGHLYEKFMEKVAKGSDPKQVLDSLGVERYCCRSLFVGHTDMIERVAKFKK